MLHSGLSDNMVTGIAEDRDGNLWFATAYEVSRFTPEPMGVSREEN
jgi:sugar lactone lactonase YvrE